MFVEVRENVFINLEQVKEIFLEKGRGGWQWVFVYSSSPWDSEDEPGYLAESSLCFSDKEEALKWFKENIKQYLKDYNRARDSLFEIATFLDTLPERINKGLKKEANNHDGIHL